MQKKKITNTAFILLVLILLVLLLKLVSSFVHTIILAILLGIILYPLHNFMLAFFRLIRRNLHPTIKKTALRKEKFVAILQSKSKVLQKKIEQEEIFFKKLLLPAQLAFFAILSAVSNKNKLDTARTIIDHQKKLAALASIIIVLFLGALPVFFLVHTSFLQGRIIINKSLQSIQKGDFQERINKVYSNEKLQNKLNKIQDSRVGQVFLKNIVHLLEVSEIVETPDLNKKDNSSSEKNEADFENKEVFALEQYSQKLDNKVILDLLQKNILSISRKTLSFLHLLTLRLFSLTGKIIFNLFLLFFVLYFVLYKGRYLYYYLLHYGPFAHDDFLILSNQIESTTRTVFIGILGAALVQSLTSMIAYWVSSLPALFLGVLTAICSIIPFVGTSLVWGSSAIYLYFQGKIGLAIFLCIWGLGLVANIDGIVRPWLMSRGKNSLPFAVLFLTILGGIKTFGFFGLIYGPLLAGIFISAMEIFAKKYKND